MSYFGSPLYFGPFASAGGAAAAQVVPAGDTLFDDVMAVLRVKFPKNGDVNLWDTVADEGGDACIVQQVTESVLRGGDWYNVDSITVQVTGASENPRRAADIADIAFNELLRADSISVSTDLGTNKTFEQSQEDDGMFFVSHTLEVKM